MALGIIGEYLARMYTETKHRPVFITRDTNIEKNESGNDNAKQ